MSSADVADFMKPLGAEAPSGEDLEYDPAFLELMQAAQGTAEIAIGQTLVEAEEPDWRDVGKRAVDLMGRTRDLRVAMHLAMAELKQRGLPAFASSMELLAALLIDLWPDVHPRLDPDDDNDPTMRLNAVEGLRSESGFLPALRAAPVCQERPAARYSFRQLLALKGMLDGIALRDDEAVSEADLDGALIKTPVESLQASVEAIDRALAQVRRIDDLLMEKVGAAASLDWAPLTRLLEQMKAAVAEYVARRGGAGPAEATQAAPAAGDWGGAPAAAPASAAVTVAPVPVASGPSSGMGGGGGLSRIDSRDDVIRAIDLICDYYQRHEPGSPVPILVGRARRLVSMSFLEILNDLAPSGVAQVKLIGGLNGEAARGDTRSVAEAPVAPSAPAPAPAPSSASSSDW